MVTTSQGQNAAAAFTGSGGQSATLQTTVTMPSSVSVLAPDGSTVLSPSLVYTTRTFTLQLPATGTYTNVVNPLGTKVGSITLKLT